MNSRRCGDVAAGEGAEMQSFRCDNVAGFPAGMKMKQYRNADIVQNARLRGKNNNYKERWTTKITMSSLPLLVMPFSLVDLADAGMCSL